MASTGKSKREAARRLEDTMEDLLADLAAAGELGFPVSAHAIEACSSTLTQEAAEHAWAAAVRKHALRERLRAAARRDVIEAGGPLAEALRATREQADCTVGEAAEVLQVEPHALEAFETGRLDAADFPCEVVATVAEALALPLRDLRTALERASGHSSGGQSRRHAAERHEVEASLEAARTVRRLRHMLRRRGRNDLL